MNGLLLHEETGVNSFSIQRNALNMTIFEGIFPFNLEEIFR